MKTISDRIFEKLKEKGMSQKEFSQKTGIAESSISDWKKKHTNPVSDKILIICEVLDISPYELLSGAEHIGTRSRDNQTYVFAKDTELGMVVVLQWWGQAPLNFYKIINLDIRTIEIVY